MAEQIELQAVAQEAEALLSRLMETADPSVRASSEQLVRVLMQMYGAGLERIVEIVRRSGDGSGALLERLAEDRLVASLFLIHGLHPASAEDRIRGALAEVERRFEGCRLALESLAGGTARVRVNVAHRSRHGRPTAALGAAIENEIREAAPEVEGIEIQSITQGDQLVQIGTAPNP